MGNIYYKARLSPQTPNYKQVGTNQQQWQALHGSDFCTEGNKENNNTAYDGPEHRGIQNSEPTLTGRHSWPVWE